MASSALRSSRRDLCKRRHNYQAQSNWKIRDGEKDFSKEVDFVLGHMLSELYVFLEATFLILSLPTCFVLSIGVKSITLLRGITNFTCLVFKKIAFYIYLKLQWANRSG